MVRRDAEGRRGPAFQMTIELGKIREFARAAMNEDPAYLEEANPPVPPTFLASMAFWEPPDAGEVFASLEIDPRRLLHGGQEYRFFGEPPVAGTVLTAQTRIDSVTEKVGRRGGTMTIAVLVTDFTDADGRLVAQGRATAIETGATDDA
jgi:hypothetical protein